MNNEKLIFDEFGYFIAENGTFNIFNIIFN